MGSTEQTFFRSVIDRGFYIADVGANQGSYALLFSQLTGPTGRVDAFEPDSLLFRALQENCHDNGPGNIVVHHCALGASNGQMRLWKSLLNSGDNRLMLVDAPGPGIDVAVQRMDDILGERPPDFIKIDVQGWEPAVFAGMEKLLASGARLRVYFEFWPYGMRAAGFEPESLPFHLLERGFRLLHPSSGRDLGRSDVSALVKSLSGKAYTNLYAWR